MNTYGHIRVSSKDQNEDRWLKAMHGLTVADKNIYIDKQSGKDLDHLIASIYDCLGHSYYEIVG